MQKAIISIAIEICTIHLYLLYIVLKQIAGKEEERERQTNKQQLGNGREKKTIKAQIPLPYGSIADSVCVSLALDAVFMRTVLACGLLFALY